MLYANASAARRGHAHSTGEALAVLRARAGQCRTAGGWTRSVAGRHRSASASGR
ncbi:hypothetical protein ACU4GD_25835 [Cupriavidus basilensis]